MNRLFNSNVEFMDFTGDKVMEWFPNWPEKVQHEESTDIKEIELEGLVNYNAIGRMYGRISTMMDVAAIQGMPVPQRMRLYVTLKAEEEQKFVDGIKYNSNMVMPSLFQLCKKWELDPAIALGVNWTRVILSRHSLAELERIKTLKTLDEQRIASLQFQVFGGELDPDYTAAMLNDKDFMDRFARFKEGFFWKLYQAHIEPLRLHGSPFSK
jgi:hypothetical protein